VDSWCGTHVQLRGDVLVFSCMAFPLTAEYYSAIVQAAFYDWSSGVWSYADTIPAPADQGADPLDSGFGSTFAFTDGLVVVGAPGTVNDGVKSGAIFLYVPSDDPSWTTSPYKLYLPGIGGDNFGTEVALDYPHLAVTNDPDWYGRSVTLYYIVPGDIYFVTQLQTRSAVAFGHSIAINANVYNWNGEPTETAILVVGDPGATNPIAVMGGAVHIYDITNPYNVFLSQTLLGQVAIDESFFGAKVITRGAGVGVFYGGASDAPASFGGLDVYVSPNGNRFSHGASKRTDFLPPGSCFGHSMDFNEYGTVVGAPCTYVYGPYQGVAVAFGW